MWTKRLIVRRLRAKDPRLMLMLCCVEGQEHLSWTDLVEETRTKNQTVAEQLLMSSLMGHKWGFGRWKFQRHFSSLLNMVNMTPAIHQHRMTEIL